MSLAEGVPDDQVAVGEVAVGCRPAAAGRRRPGSGWDIRRPGTAPWDRMGVTQRLCVRKPARFKTDAPG